jgi:hypothetical protein
MEEKKEFIIPDFIFDKYINIYEEYPCITTTKNVLKTGIDLITQKNEIIWSKTFYDGYNEKINEGLINYNEKNKIMIYFNRYENEDVYRLFVFSTTKNKEMVYFLIKGLNKYFTID